MKVNDTTGGVLFEEKQKLPRWLAVVLLSPVLIATGLIVYLAKVEEFNQNELWPALFIMIPLELIIFYAFFAVRLEKVISTNGLYYRWHPFQKKYRLFTKEQISSVSTRRPPRMKIGPNWIPGYGWMHSANSGEGIEVQLTNGKKIFLGTADLVGFQRSMQQILSSNRKTSSSEF